MSHQKHVSGELALKEAKSACQRINKIFSTLSEDK
jgi:hypothetical protein